MIRFVLARALWAVSNALDDLAAWLLAPGLDAVPVRPRMNAGDREMLDQLALDIREHGGCA